MTKNKKKNIYPPLIILLLCSFLIFSFWSAFQAAGLGSKVADLDYYSKGLKYNTTQIEKRAAETLGWNIETELKGHKLLFRLTDRTGKLVDHATGTLYMAIPDSQNNIHLPLREISSGQYQVILDDSVSGAIQARLKIERLGARINRQFLLNL